MVSMAVLTMSLLPYYLIFFNLYLFVSSLLIEDLQSLFGDKHCIEASLFPLSSDKEEFIVLDANSLDKESVSVTNTTDKTVTSKIHELAQYHEIEFLYKLISEDGPPHAKTYVVQLKLGDETYEGTGSSLKKAKQAAAALALSDTFYERPPEKLKEEEQQPQTPTVILNNIAMKLGIGVQYFLLNGQEEQAIDSYGSYDQAYGKSKALYPNINSSSDPLRIPTENPQVSGPFAVKVKVGEFTFKGVGHTIQGARHDGAMKALEHMQKEVLFKDNVCSKDESMEECKQKKESLKSPVSRVYETAQKHNLPLEFNLISETGKSHKKIFVTQCKLADFITEGEGSSKKESKKAAAEKMVKYLSELPAIYDEKAIINGLSDKKKKKKKKKKIHRDSVENLMQSVVQMASNLWDNTDDNSKTNSDSFSQNKLKTTSKKQNKSPKSTILEISAKYNIPIEFTDLYKNGNAFLSLISLGVKPPYLCLGKAAKRETSHDVAALHGLKFLHKFGIFDKLDITQIEKSDLLEELEEFDNDNLYKPLEDVNKDIM